MKYYQIKEVYSSKHNLTYVDSTRDWFLGSDDEKVYNWSDLSLVRFYSNSNAEPNEKIPVIEIKNVEQECCDYSCMMPDGKLIDFFSIGIYYFVSNRLMNLFHKNHVEAFFSKASITIDNIVYPEPYYLFTPRDMFDVLDESKSIFSTKINLGGDVVIDKIESYVLNYEDIPLGQVLFYLQVKGKRRPLMIREDITEKIIKEGVVGLGFLSVDDMKSL